MTVRWLRCMLVIIVALFLKGPVLCLAQSDQDQYDYIDISNPFLRKIPLAVPLFINETGTGEEKRLSNSSVELLAASLEFTGYFKLLDRGAFLFDAQKDGILTPQINFANWTVIGSELLITGLFKEVDGNVTMELRLFDTFKARRIVGKKYTGKKADLRRMIHRFCSEVIKHLTGQRGVFGSKIAFVSNGSGNKEIYTCAFDGYNAQQMTRNRSINLSPAWSSDGRYLAYTSYKKKTPGIFIKNLAEMQETSINKKGLNITPAWVPGKFELAATLSFAGDQEIYLLTVSGKVIKRLTNIRGIDVSPTSTPDGKHLAFVSPRAGSPQV